ncbi:nitroreductase family protein [Actinoplanes regularis]|uniref:nitroreductase family protein n=1 Tax=Actinoplanes regularis TaxID=52697 RepID=UPI0023B2C86D|nr:nitroreductase family protein [Actinoplanes regularis]
MSDLRSPAADRYGDPTVDLAAPNDVLRLQLAHRSVRRFGPRDVTERELATLIAAAQSAPTSSNLQPWSVVAVRDPQRKARLATLAGNQAFVAQAPLFLVWLADSWSGWPTSAGPAGWPGAPGSRSAPPTTWRRPSSASSTPPSRPRTPCWPPGRSASAPSSSARSATGRWRSRRS